jgi:hypothetical protein
MSSNPIVIHGVVKPDGTLELDPAVKLSPGRVQVTIQPMGGAKPSAENWWQNLQRARAALEARGTGFRTQQEIEAEREAFRSGDERIEEVYRQVEEARRREQNGC